MVSLIEVKDKIQVSWKRSWEATKRGKGKKLWLLYLRFHVSHSPFRSLLSYGAFMLTSPACQHVTSVFNQTVGTEKQSTTKCFENAAIFLCRWKAGKNLNKSTFPSFVPQFCIFLQRSKRRMKISKNDAIPLVVLGRWRTLTRVWIKPDNRLGL